MLTNTTQSQHVSNKLNSSLFQYKLPDKYYSAVTKLTLYYGYFNSLMCYEIALKKIGNSFPA